MLLVTGGAGFIGSNVVAALNEAGRSDVVVCDFLGNEGKWRNLAKRQLVDIVPPAELPDWLKGRKLDAVIHLGAISATTATDGDLVFETNFRLSMRLLDWCTANAVPLIYASSAATYGDGKAGFDDDASVPALKKLRPMNLYGWSKHLFDLAVAERAANGEKLPPQWAGLKFFNVFGPNEYHKGSMMSVLARRFDDVKAGRVVQLFKSHREGIADGDQRRDFIYVDDVVRVIMWLLATPSVSGAGVPTGTIYAGGVVAATFSISAAGAVTLTPAQGSPVSVQSGTLDLSTGVLSLLWSSNPGANQESDSRAGESSDRRRIPWADVAVLARPVLAREGRDRKAVRGAGATNATR